RKFNAHDDLDRLATLDRHNGSHDLAHLLQVLLIEPRNEHLRNFGGPLTRMRLVGVLRRLFDGEVLGNRVVPLLAPVRRPVVAHILRQHPSPLVGVDDLWWGAGLAHGLNYVGLYLHRRHGDRLRSIGIEEHRIVWAPVATELLAETLSLALENFPG